MYFNQPVRVPAAPGKITFRKKGGSTYVEYLVCRLYDPNSRQNRCIRKEIGAVIPGRPEMMLPNENFVTYVLKGEGEMEKREAEAQEYATERERCFMLRDFFDQLFYEFQMMSRRNGGKIVNENKVKRLNRILEPLMEMMSGEAYAPYLERIPEPIVEEDEKGQERLKGLTYGDVALLMTQFKGALNRYFQKRV